MTHQRLTVACLLLALVHLHVAGHANEQIIATIRTRYSKVDQDLKHCKRVKRDLWGYSTEGGYFTLYSCQSSPRKLVVWFYGETGKASEEYYFGHNRLFFVLRTESRYDKPLGKVIRVTQDRFYFDQGKLIRWIDTQKNQVPLTKSEAQQREQEVLRHVRELLKIAQRPAAPR